MARRNSSLIYISLVLLLSFLLVGTYAADNGFDPTMDMPMSLAMGDMLMYFHVKPGDVLWFQGWVPGTNSTLFGTCVGLFVLGLLERWIVAMRAAMEFAIWRGSSLSSTKLLKDDKEKILVLDSIMLRGAAPFVLQHALPRGILHMTQVSIGFLFMLAIMTFQVAFILSIIIGVGVGEMMYGRYIDAATTAMHLS